MNKQVDVESFCCRPSQERASRRCARTSNGDKTVHWVNIVSTVAVTAEL